MISFVKSKPINSHSSSFSVTYPRDVNIVFGHYPFPERVHNLRMKVKSGVDSKMKNFTNVQGEMTPWHYFEQDKDFVDFINYLINKHQESHPGYFEHFYSKKTIEGAWGNLYKKGDSLIPHMHYSNSGILFLSEGSDLILSELNIKITPCSGDYYIFPPVILHGFKPILNDEERCSIAFNMVDKRQAEFLIDRKIKEVNERNKTKDS
tara:strand:- start:495 stop:1115 length:621 start_codon:yes stop_codon:yes gene_type:complete